MIRWLWTHKAASTISPLFLFFAERKWNPNCGRGRLRWQDHGKLVGDERDLFQPFHHPSPSGGDRNRDRTAFSFENRKLDLDRRLGFANRVRDRPAGRQSVGGPTEDEEAAREDGPHSHPHRSRLSHLPLLQARGSDLSGKQLSIERDEVVFPKTFGMILLNNLDRTPDCTIWGLWETNKVKKKT